MKVRKTLGTLFLVTTMLISIIVPSFNNMVSAEEGVDYSNQVVIEDWDILDSTGTPLSETNEVGFSRYQLWVKWSLTLTNGDTLKEGDNFSVRIPKNQSSGSWSALNSDWENFFASDGVTILGQWRIQSNMLEVQLGTEVESTFSISGEFKTGNNALSNGARIGMTQYVTMGQVSKLMKFQQHVLSELSGTDSKSSSTSSNTNISWSVAINRNGGIELSEKEWGTNFVKQENVYLEDVIEGKIESLSIMAITRLPCDLVDGKASIASYNLVVTSYFTKIEQETDESYNDFKNRLLPLQWGVYIDENDIQTLIIYYGDIGNNGLRYSDINPTFYKAATTIAINTGYYAEADRSALEGYMEKTYGDTNVINGNVASFTTYFTVKYPKVSTNTVKKNTAIVTKNGVSKNITGSGTLQGVSGSGTSVTAESGKVNISDADDNTLLKDVSFKLQVKQSGNWVDYGWTGSTNDEGFVETPTLGPATYRFVQTGTASAEYDLSSSDGYDSGLDTCISDEFDIVSGGSGKVVTMTNVKYKYTVTYKPGTQGDFTDNVHSNVVINTSTPTFSGSTDSITGKPLGKKGYSFDGWDQTIASTVTSTLDYTATWKANVYGITYELDGGTNNLSNPIEYTYGLGVSTFEEPTKVGHTFKGWYSENTFENEVTSISTTQTEAVTLYAKWEANEYGITYNLDGGTNDVSNPSSYTYGIGVSSFEEPTKEGHTFKGWYDNATFDNEITVVSTTKIGAVTLYAKWEVNKYGVSYELDGGTNDVSNPTSYTYGVGVSSFEEPNKVGHTFKGWYSENTFENEVTSISTTQTEAVALYAKWEANTYNITYHLDGGTNDVSNPISYTYGIGVSSFEEPTKEGHTFEGWYTLPILGMKVIDIETTRLGDITLYARWTPNKYDIIYNLDGGVNHSDNPTTYTY
ncbi:MAG: InlB B-repeat-containing protein [Coprobacillaceae bacterium]